MTKRTAKTTELTAARDHQEYVSKRYWAKLASYADYAAANARLDKAEAEAAKGKGR